MELNLAKFILGTPKAEKCIECGKHCGPMTRGALLKLGDGCFNALWFGGGPRWEAWALAHPKEMKEWLAFLKKSRPDVARSDIAASEHEVFSDILALQRKESAFRRAGNVTAADAIKKDIEAKNKAMADFKARLPGYIAAMGKEE